MESSFRHALQNKLKSRENNNPVVGGLAAAIASSLGSGAGGEAGLSSIVEGGLGSSFAFDADYDNAPKAYLSWIFFDENVQFNGEFGFEQLSTAAQDNYIKLEKVYEASSSGYLYIYVANETDKQSVDVFFDDIKVTHTESKVTTHDYYPFGMNISAISSDVSQHYSNKYLYSGKELQTDHGLDWQHFGFRYYDAALGRWHVKEPLADQMPGISTYAYSYNSPVVFKDIMGLNPGSSERSKPFWMRKQYDSSFDSDGDGFLSPAERWAYNGWSAGTGKPKYFSERDKKSAELLKAAKKGDLLHVDQFTYAELPYETVYSIWYTTGFKYTNSFFTENKTKSSNEEKVHWLDDQTSGGSSVWSDFQDGFLNGPQSNLDADVVAGGQGIITTLTDVAVRNDARYASKFSQLRKVAQASKYVKTGGTVLGGFSIAYNTIDGLSDGKLTAGEAYKIAIAGASLHPVFGTVMGVTDLATQMYFGTSLTDMVANGIDSSTGGAYIELW